MELIATTVERIGDYVRYLLCFSFTRAFQA